MALIDDFRSRFPEFTVSQVDTYLPSLEDIWGCYYGGDYELDCDKEIILNLLAHLLVGEINTSSVPTQVESSRSVGSVSQSFFNGNIDGGNAFFMTTKYGRRYWMLTMKNIGGRFV